MVAKRILAYAITISFLPIAYVFIGADEWTGASYYLLFDVYFISLGVLLGMSALSLGRHKGFLIAPLLFIALVLVLPFIDNTPVKPAMRAVGEIQPGMSERDVRAVLDKHFPADGRFKRPETGPISDNHISFALDRTDPTFNAAFVWVKFESGRCISAQFFAD